MIRWSYAFIDRPFAGYERALEFWSALTETTVSSRRGELGQFATLLPRAGDACVKVQAVGDGGGAHIDLSVEDVPAYARRAAQLGASELFAEPGLVVMRSPGGQGFCLCRWDNESVRPPETINEIHIDVSPHAYDAESAFWADLTSDADALPVEVVLRRLDSPGPLTARVGLAGSRAWHERYGAVLVAQGPSWIEMRDPAGGEYRLVVQ